MNRGATGASADPQIKLGEPATVEVETTGDPAGIRARAWGATRILQTVLILVAAIFLGLHYVHLNADFPNNSPWMDWSKYTDEGWYGDAAIRQLQRGSWYVGGDFNPGVALPVWPALEFLLFSVTGVSPVAARALSVSVLAGILISAFLLMRRSSTGTLEPEPGAFRFRRTSLAAACAVVLLAVSPFCFVFTRLAILEPLLVLLMLLALLAASGVRAGRLAPAVCLGVLLPVMVLTKTTAVFLAPSILWMLWASNGFRFWSSLKIGAIAGGIAATLWGSYFLFLVRPHFLEDYRYLFSANAYTGMTRENAWSVIQSTVSDGMWMGRLIYPVGLIAIAVACAYFRRCFRNPLVPALILWAGGYATFLAYHDNLQPRYYLVIAVPLTLLVPVVAEEVYLGLAAAGRGGLLDRRVWLTVISAALVAVAVWDVKETLHYVETPEYTFVRAAKDLSSVVLADKQHNPLVLSISGSNISLLTGLPSICDDFGTMALEDRVAKYRPGWYATWNQVDDDKMDALSPMFHLVKVASFQAFDDPERNLLILYRLDPPEAEAPRKRHRKPVPKQLQTKIGQQPSTTQLEH